jgi:hypothetical protein
MLVFCESSHVPDAIASGVMQPSAIGAGDDCCDRGAHELFGDGPRVRRRPVLTMAPPLVAIVALTAWP